MNGIHHPGCCIDCIDSFLCFTPVARFSMDVDLHTVDHGRRLPLMNRHPKSHVRCIMEHEKCIRFRILQSSCLEHPSGTFSDFFCRFKKEANPYRESFFFLLRFIFLLSFAAFLFLILFLCYDLREDQCCRQNKIMSAGMPYIPDSRMHMAVPSAPVSAGHPSPPGEPPVSLCPSNREVLRSAR